MFPNSPIVDEKTWGIGPAFLSGLMVFGATTATGIIEQGRVMHPAGAGVTCRNWWTDADSQVERSIIMDNYIFSISRSVIKVNSLDDLSTDLASVSL